VDVYEIDGASNNSVDQIRELRDNIKYMPAHSPYKIYIIDEVHMLSTPAFNALLKTLEEPPAHVMFIFATTEPHKIPITILSRCQRHDFRRLSLSAISSQLAAICSQEGVSISSKSLGILAREAGGSMRDALSLLDQVISSSAGHLEENDLLDLAGALDQTVFADISNAVLKADVSALLETIQVIFERGYDLKKSYTDLLQYFRNLLVAKVSAAPHKLLDLPDADIQQLVEQARQYSAADLHQVLELLFKEDLSMRRSTQPKLAFEMALLRVLQVKPVLPIDVLIEKLDRLRSEIPSSTGKTAASAGENKAARKASGSQTYPLGRQTGAGQGVEAAPASENDVNAVQIDLDATWLRLINLLAEKNPSLAAYLSKCRLKHLSDEVMEIEVPDNGLTLNLIQRKKNEVLLKEIARQFFRQDKLIRFSIQTGSPNNGSQKKSQQNQLKQMALNNPLVADAIDIFNGRLVEVKILEEDN
jgi:DNA polymerase-3 subunit gamma/tau